MSHHHPRHPHRHHVRTPEGPKSDNSLFWLLMIFLVALMGLGFWLSRPALPPAVEAANHSCTLSTRGLECGDPSPPISVPDVLPAAERTALPDPEPEPQPTPAIEPEPTTEPAPITIHVAEPVRHHAKPQHHHRAKPIERHTKPAHKREPAKPVHRRRPAPVQRDEIPAYTPPDNTPVWNDPSKYPYIPDEQRE